MTQAVHAAHYVYMKLAATGGTKTTFPAGHLSTSPAALAAVVKRSMCPTCEGREPGPEEEAYASCFLCAA